MADIFDRWDEQIDGEGMAKDIADAAAGGNGDYPDVPYGTYEVSVNKMELKASSKGDPMISIWFKIVSDGEFKGSMIFYNQVLTKAFCIHKANTMLRALSNQDGKIDVEIDDCCKGSFSYKKYNQIILDVFEMTGNFEYALKFSQNKKNSNFNDYEITEVFELED